MTAPPAIRTERLQGLDLYRGLAVLWMIETHTLNTFLAPSYLAQWWFPWLNYANGLVAPGFLFIAGFVQGLSMRQPGFLTKPLAPRLRRLGSILLAGYALRFPWAVLGGGRPDSGAAIWTSLCRVDILHCLAVSLAVLLLAGRKVRSLDGVFGVLGLLALMLSPLVWQEKFSAPALSPLLSFLTPQFGALFPLLPWLAFVACGSIASRWATRPAILTVAAIISWLAGFAIKFGCANWLARLPYAAYAVRADFFAERLGWTLLLAAVCLWLRRPERFRLLTFMGANSLLLYVLHLQTIQLIGGANTHSPAAVALLFLAVLAAPLLISGLVALFVRR